MYINNSRFSQKYLVLLFIIHIFSHYITFERASLGQDTYADKLRLLNNSNLGFLDYFKLSVDRPFNFIFLDFQNRIITDSLVSLTLLIVSTFIILLSVFIFIYLITNSLTYAFLTSLIFDLLPIKSEIFHNIVYLNINIVTSIYIFSIISFFLFIKNEKKVFFALSCICYFIGIFWYEIGFFVPIFYFICLFLYKKINKKTIIFMVFLSSISILYLLYRYFNSFGLSVNEESHAINLSTENRSIQDIFNFIFGRYLFKYVVYGLYQILSLNIFYIFILFILNSVLIYLISYNLKNIKTFHLNKNNLFLLLILFLIILFPIILNGSAAGRHFIIPSIAISFITISLLYLFFAKKLVKYFNLIIFFLLFIAQGNCIIQTNSMKIEKDFVNFVNENKYEIQNSDLVLVDVESYMSNIKHTLVNNNNNFFNTYFGYQMFETWGISSIINIYSNNYKTKNIKKIDYSIGSIKINEQYTEYQSIQLKKYNQYDLIIKRFNYKKIFIINFEKVYKNKSRLFKIL